MRYDHHIVLSFLLMSIYAMWLNCYKGETVFVDVLVIKCFSG